MKKFIFSLVSILLAFSMVFSFVACDQEKNDDASQNEKPGGDDDSAKNPDDENADEGGLNNGNPEKIEIVGTEGLAYKLTTDGTGYVVMGIGTATATDIVIGNTYKGKPVVAIISFAFLGCTSLTSVTVSDGVMSIALSAFWGCINLTSVVIPNSVTRIGGAAFDGCESLSSITYLGTKAEWEATEKGSNWDNEMPVYTVHCIDGDITK